MSRSTEQPEIRSQNKMILQLACRAQRDLQEASKVRLGPPPATLRNVRTDRRRGAPDLCRETIQLLPGKRPRRVVQGKLPWALFQTFTLRNPTIRSSRLVHARYLSPGRDLAGINPLPTCPDRCPLTSDVSMLLRRPYPS